MATIDSNSGTTPDENSTLTVIREVDRCNCFHFGATVQKEEALLTTLQVALESGRAHLIHNDDNSRTVIIAFTIPADGPVYEPVSYPYASA